MATMGSTGTGDGQLVNPFGMAVDDSGHVYVGDYGNNRVQRFSKTNESTYTYAWQYAVTEPTGTNRSPTS